MAVSMTTLQRRRSCEEIDGVLYPYAEEEPAVQGSLHFWTVNEAVNMVGALLRGWPRAAISADVFVFWEEGNPRKRRRRYC